MIRATAIIVLLSIALFAVIETDAGVLSCNVAQVLSSTCTTSDKRHRDGKPYGDSPYTGGVSAVDVQTCNTEAYGCLSAQFVGFSAAFGCMGPSSGSGDYMNQIANAKTKIKAACNADATCKKYNTNGEPKGGWVVCNTTNCNPCGKPATFNAGGAIAPSLLMGFLASLVPFMSSA